MRHSYSINPQESLKKLNAMIYDVDYFIQKFEAIPEDRWTTGNYNTPGGGKSCAYGHCGMTDFNVLSDAPEALAFNKILSCAVGVNDGEDERYQQSTPKARILAALYDVKKLQSKDTKEIIKYVAVDAEIRQDANEKIIQPTLSN